MDNSENQDFKVSVSFKRTNQKKPVNKEVYHEEQLRYLWLEYGHPEDLKQSQFEGRGSWR
jgi:hypothetical protein